MIRKYTASSLLFLKNYVRIYKEGEQAAQTKTETMKTPVAVLIISLLHLPAAELQQEPECNIPKTRQVDVSFSCTGKEQLCLPVVAAKEVGAKVEDSEGKLEGESHT